MKKTAIILICIWTALLFSCNEDESQTPMVVPQPSFTTDKEAYTIGEEVVFSDTSTPNSSPIKEWYWHFGFDGKGNYSTEQNPTFLYSKAGKYAVKLTVTDESGAYATYVDTVLIRPSNMPPVASFTVNPSICKVNEEITFTDTSVDEDGQVVSRLWDLGNGITSTEKEVKTTYTSTGFIIVKLTVTDDRGESTTKEMALNIRADVSPGGFEILWSKEFESASELRSISPSVGGNGNVYISSNALKLHAFSPNGDKLWSYDLATEGGSGGNQGSSPVVDSNGDIYIGVYPASGKSEMLHGFRPDGTKKWTYSFVSGVRIDYSTPAIAPDGNILIGSRGTDGGLHKVNKNTGERIWSAKSPNGGVNGSIIIDRNGVTYAVLTSAHGISRTNNEGVNLSPNLGKDKSYYGSGVTPAIDSDGTIYAGFEQGVIAAYDPATGLSKWENTTLGKLDHSGIVISADGNLYAGTSDASPRLVALSKNGGIIKWSYPTGAIVQSTPSIDNLGNIHFGDNAGYYTILDKNGNELHRIKLGTKIWSSPVISEYGIIYVAVEDSGSCKLIAIDCGIAGPADTAWPQRGQNPQRTGLQK